MTGPRGQLRAYLAFQAKDFLLLRASLPTAVVVMFAWMMIATVQLPADGWESPQGRMIARQVFDMLSTMFVLAGAFLGVARIVSDDRSNGYYRFLFSKPVSMCAFYMQQWIVNGVGLVVLIGLLASLFGALTVPVPVGAAMQVMAVTWVLVGGVGFALSVGTNYDVPVLVVSYVGSSVLHSLKDSPGSAMAPWMRQIVRVTMPVQHVDHVRAALFAGNPLPLAHAGIAVAYGALFVVAAVVLMRRVSFAR
ncbi:MAG: hypothetical protein IT356_07445 [Gemmatimonadaceae bacterium]|nr:hypothetical protein [Gemmatimonadaceae bacterium]